MRFLFTLCLCTLWSFSVYAQTPTSSTALIQCGCGSSSVTTASLSDVEARMLRGIPAYIVLRGQRFGGVFGESVGAGSGALPGGYDIPLFPNILGSTLLGGGISLQTANLYGTLIGPFKAGLPTIATIVAEVVDAFGDVVKNESGSYAVLSLGSSESSVSANTFETRPVYYPGGRIQYRYLPNIQVVPDQAGIGRTGQALQARSQNGRFEWEGVNIGGIAGTTLTLAVRHISLPTCGCPVQVSLQGGYADYCTFASQNINLNRNTKILPNAEGPFAVPGRIGSYTGSAPHMMINETVSFPYTEPGYSGITIVLRDRFNNLASFSTKATLSIGVDKAKSIVVGDVSVSKVQWGLGKEGRESITGRATNTNKDIISSAVMSPQIMSHLATFPFFKVMGATANNVSLIASINSDPTLEALRIGVEFLSTFATVSVFPGSAVALAPVLIPDIYNRNALTRIPGRFYTGRTNKPDPRTWFYVQAIDEYGNRADGGPNAYNGGTASITFQAPENGLPRASGVSANAFYTPNGFQFSPSSDRYVKANAQRYTARGTSAIAVNGLYTFNDFTAFGAVSLDQLGNDIVLTFEDTNLPGFVPCSNCGSLGRPILPPITTATTTFIQTPLISIVVPEATQDGEPKNGAQRLSENTLLLHERSATYISSNRTLETGSLRVERPITARSNDIVVAYTLRYVSIDSTFNGIPVASTFVPTSRTFDLPNIGRGAPLLLPIPITLPAPFLSPLIFPPFPTPSPFIINGLQNGDLSPRTTPVGRSTQIVNITPQGQPNIFFLDDGVTSQLVNFTARWSDQAFPRTPGRQGLRAVIIKLLNPDNQNATIYSVDESSGKDTALVFLVDPPPEPPVITNAIQDKVLLRPNGSTPTEDRIELEFPQWRQDQVPGSVFYDDNYDPLTYTASSSDPTKVIARIVAGDLTVVSPGTTGRPTLYYAAQPGTPETSVVITAVANDGTTSSDGRLHIATDQFNIRIRNSVTSVESGTANNKAGLSVSPNPANNEASIKFSLPETADVHVEVLSVQGTPVISIDAGAWHRESSVLFCQPSDSPPGCIL